VQPHGDPVQHDASENTVSLVKLVTEIGPDIAEISRRLGQYKESVRYRYKEKIVRRGFAIKADLDYGALGLTRAVMKIRVTEAYSRQVHALFEAMSDLCYVVAYAGTMPNDVYIVHGAVPQELTSQYHRFIEGLKDKGIFSSVEFFDCPWFRVAPMRGECFNFDEAVWDFDWSNPPPVDEKAARATISQRKKVDKIDLLILKELWKNSDRSVMDIQESIKKTNGVEINYKTLNWHYSHHVLGQHMIRDYSIAWHGMTYNIDLQKIERVGKHGYLGVSLIVRETDEKDRMMLRSELNRLPFLWSEAAGDAYYSQLFFPLDTVNEALEYLKTIMKPYGERAEIFLLDRREMTSFTIGYGLWDEASGRWTFDATGLLPRLESSLMKIRERSA